MKIVLFLDIDQVAKELGHSSVTTTEIYTRFNIRRLVQDFPNLASWYWKSIETRQGVRLVGVGLR